MLEGKFVSMPCQSPVSMNFFHRTQNTHFFVRLSLRCTRCSLTLPSWLRREGQKVDLIRGQVENALGVEKALGGLNIEAGGQPCEQLRVMNLYSAFECTGHDPILLGSRNLF